MFSLLSKDKKSVFPPGTTAAQVLDAIIQLMAEENTNHYRMGQYFNYMVDNKLAETAGFKDAPDLLRKKLPDVSPSTMATYAVVERNFSEPIAVRFGVTRLSLLLTYKEAAGIVVDHDEPGPTLIEVPGDNGAMTSKAFKDCSVSEMRKAIQRRRKPTSSKPLPQEDVEFADQLRALVVGRFAKGDPVKVQMRNHGGNAIFDFMGIPKAKLQALLLTRTSADGRANRLVDGHPSGACEPSAGVMSIEPGSGTPPGSMMASRGRMATRRGARAQSRRGRARRRRACA
jgi:hypothetical protein